MAKGSLPLIFAAGLASAFIFYLGWGGHLVSVFLSFSPIFPICLLAFSNTAIKAVLLAIGIACAFLLISGNVAMVFLYLLLTALPCLMFRWDYRFPGFMPIGGMQGSIKLRHGSQALILMTVYGAVVFLAVAFVVVETQGNLESSLISLMLDMPAAFRSAVDDPGMDVNAFIATHGKTLAFAFCLLPMALWISMNMLFAWLAHFTLFSYGKAIRPFYSIVPHGLPLWLLAAVITNAAFVIIANLFYPTGSAAFIGKVCLGIFMIPYMLYGIALVHSKSRMLKVGRTFLLVFFYFLLLNPLFAAGVGMVGFFWHLRQTLSGNGRMPD